MPEVRKPKVTRGEANGLLDRHQSSHTNAYIYIYIYTYIYIYMLGYDFSDGTPFHLGFKGCQKETPQLGGSGSPLRTSWVAQFWEGRPILTHLSFSFPLEEDNLGRRPHFLCESPIGIEAPVGRGFRPNPQNQAIPTLRGMLTEPGSYTPGLFGTFASKSLGPVRR